MPEGKGTWQPELRPIRGFERVDVLSALWGERWAALLEALTATVASQTCSVLANMPSRTLPPGSLP